MPANITQYVALCFEKVKPVVSDLAGFPLVIEERQGATVLGFYTETGKLTESVFVLGTPGGMRLAVPVDFRHADIEGHIKARIVEGIAAFLDHATYLEPRMLEAKETNACK